MLPIAAPGLVAAYILTVVLCWNEYFIALVLASTDAVTLPFLIAGQVSSQGVKWWTMAALTCAAIAAAAHHRHPARAIHRQGADRRIGEVARTARLRGSSQYEESA